MRRSSRSPAENAQPEAPAPQERPRQPSRRLPRRATAALLLGLAGVAWAQGITITPGAQTTTTGLTFTPTDYGTRQTVTVTGVDDHVDNGSDRQTTTAHTATSGDYEGLSPGVVTVTAADDDPRGVTVTESQGETRMTEGGFDAYRVVLDSQPTADVTITASSGNATVARVAPPTLTFTTSNWNTVQTVTVTGIDDKVDNAVNRSTTITHTATGGDYEGLSVGSVTVTVVDDDTRGVTITESDGDTEVSETGDTDTYKVVLTSQPTAHVTVAVAVADTAVATVNPASLTFTASNWASEKIVTVTAVDDEVDNGTSRQTTIRHTATGGDYVALSIDSVAVTVINDDTRGVSVTESGGDTRVAEDGGTDSYTVALATEPTAAVTVAVAVSDPAVATVSPTRLTFTPTNWRSVQTVVVVGEGDDLDNAADRQTTVRHTATGGDYRAVRGASVTVTAVDNDTRGVVVTESDRGTQVAEDGGISTYTVVLSSQPTAAVTIAVSVDDLSVVLASPASLTFTSANWNLAQEVTVTGVGDDLDNATNRQTTIRHTASDGDYQGLSVASVTVVAVDDDAKAITVMESGNGTRMAEDGGTDTYAVVLGSQPTAQVTVQVAVGDNGVATAAPTSLTFTTTNWGNAQTVTVTGVDDDVDNAAYRQTRLEHTAAGGDYEGLRASITVTAVDDDGRGVTVTKTDSENRVAEDGGSATYTVVLDTAPTADVTVTATPVDTSVATASPGSMTFTTSNWNSAQMVTVRGVDDDVDNEPDRRTTIVHAATGGDYDGLSILSVLVTAGDDDVRGITVAGSGNRAWVDEAGGRATYTVVLQSAPTGNVTVTAVPADAEIATASPAALTFTAGNWAVAQTVTITGVDDDVDNAADRQTTIEHAVSGGGYEGLSAGSVAVTVLDDDIRGVTVIESRGDTTVAEDGGTDTYTVVLDTEPTGNVTVTVVSDNGAIATVSPSLAFTIGDWATARTVTVTGVDDDVVNDPARQTTIRHTAIGSDYDTVSGANVTVTVVDDDADDGDDDDGGDDGDIARSITVGYMPARSDPMHEGFVRVVNLDDQAATVSIDAIDDIGVTYDRMTLALPAGAARHFNSTDLEDGNADKGLTGATGSGNGDWRLLVASEQDIEWQSYVRTADGFLTAVHDAVVVDSGAPATLPTFNPGSNMQQVSSLRLVNLGADAAVVTIAGIDDAGASPGDGVTAALPGGRAVAFTSAEMESGIAPRLTGSLGDGTGKWRLVIESTQPMLAMSLMSSPSGHLTNLSTVPTTDGHVVPLFPPASDPFGRQGFARVVNRSGIAGFVTIWARDESDRSYAPITLAIGAGQTRHFNSDDLEGGNVDKGLTGSTGAGAGDWWLELTSALDIEVLSYVRTRHDGFLTSMHDFSPVAEVAAPAVEDVHDVVTLDPVSPENQGVLRLLNPGAAPASVALLATDDDGTPGASVVRLTVPPWRAVNLTSDQLESGDDDAFDGSFGDGEGRWRLTVTADQPVHVMSLINARQTGHLTNLSTTIR